MTLFWFAGCWLTTEELLDHDMPESPHRGGGNGLFDSGAGDTAQHDDRDSDADTDGDTDTDTDGDTDADGDTDTELWSCVDEDLGDRTSWTGPLLGTSDDDLGLSCQTYVAARDTVLSWTAPSSGCWRVRTSGDGDTILGAYQGGCSGREFACNDDVDSSAYVLTSVIDVDLAAGDTVLLVVESYRDDQLPMEFGLQITACGP